MNDGNIKIYALAVCFSSLMCAAITTGVFLFNIVKLVAPEATIDPSTISYYSSNEAFRNSPFSFARARSLPYPIASDGVIGPRAALLNEPSAKPELSDEEIENLRVQQHNAIISNHKFRARQGIIQQSIIILISLLLFTAHWKSAKKLNHKSNV